MFQKLGKRTRLFLISIVLTSAIVIIGNAVIAIVLGEPIIGEGHFGSIDAVDVAVLHFIFTGLPFFMLAALGDQRLILWIAAAALTIATWAYSAWRIWRASLIDFAGGADIGLGLIMMAAPFAISLCLALLGLVLKLRRV